LKFLTPAALLDFENAKCSPKSDIKIQLSLSSSSTKSSPSVSISSPSLSQEKLIEPILTSNDDIIVDNNKTSINNKLSDSMETYSIDLSIKISEGTIPVRSNNLKVNSVRAKSIKTQQQVASDYNSGMIKIAEKFDQNAAVEANSNKRKIGVLSALTLKPSQSMNKTVFSNKVMVSFETKKLDHFLIILLFFRRK
jgi:hypothetical protein